MTAGAHGFPGTSPETVVALDTLFLAKAEGAERMQKKGQHVVPNGARWSVRQAGATRASGTFATQKEAIVRGTELAKTQKTELYIHGSDGRIRERNSYGNDPYPPKG